MLMTLLGGLLSLLLSIALIIEGALSLHYCRRVFEYGFILSRRSLRTKDTFATERKYKRAKLISFSTCLNAKKKNKRSNNSNKRRYHDHDKDHEVIDKLSLAANRPIASIGGVSEDHNFEQFFYSEKSTRQIYQLAKTFSHPLFLCNPSLAILANDDKIPYLLLDRDKRFNFLRKFKEFSLTEPYLISSYSYDAIFVDPPFANITPGELVKCIKMMAPTKEKLTVPIYIAYNGKREQDLINAFEELPCPNLERLWRLEYRSISDDDLQIYLYGPTNL